MIAAADALYRQREQLPHARQAAALYEREAYRDYDAAWKAARAWYWLATAGDDKERQDARERGVKAGEQAVKLNPDRPEGHFWLAATLGEVAEHASFFTAWRYPGRIRKELEIVHRMDPAWQQGSADRALGAWYFRVPGISGGDDRKAEAHLRAALTYNPQSTVTLFFLAQVVAKDRKRLDEARALLRQVLDAPLDPEWAPEDRRFKAQAAELLAKLGGA